MGRFGNFKNLLEDKLFIQAIKIPFLCYYNSSSFYCDFTDSGIYLERKIFLRKFLRMCFLFHIFQVL